MMTKQRQGALNWAKRDGFQLHKEFKLECRFLQYTNKMLEIIEIEK